MEEHSQQLLSDENNLVPNEIEDVDISTINGIPDFFKEFRCESKKLWYLAGPAIFTSVAQYTIGALTQVFAGHLGTIQLAAISVENGVVAAFGYGILMGMGSALETLCGQAFGANHRGVLGIYLQRSWVILTTAVFPILFLFVFATPVLKFLGQSAEISKEAGKLALWMIPQQFAYAMIIPLSKFLQAQSKVMEMASISALALCLHSFLSWLLMMKLDWGLPGAAMVLNASWWFMALAQFLFVIAGFCGEAWSGFSWKALTNLTEFVKLSVSSALMFCLEIWYSIALTLVAGNLKNAEISVDALSICRNIMGWSGTVGLGFNVAISVRVSNELGSRHPRAAKFSVMVVVVTSLLLSLLFAAVLLLEHSRYPALFSTSAEVKQLVEELTPLLALGVVLSCVQYTLSGVAIGAGWQKFVAFLNLGCYFLFAVPFGILLCFKFDMGVKGVWYGLILGLCLQSLALFWVICITNWNQEASSAEKRLELWGGESVVESDEEK